MNSLYSAPTCSATRFAYLSSLKSCSSKPIEKVLTGCEDSCAISATTVEESTPPERKAPSGTSEIILRLVDSRSSRVVSSMASSSPMSIFFEKSGRQYRRVSISPLLHRSQCPGSSLQISLYAVIGAGTHENDRYASIAWWSIYRDTAGCS